jgi:hypothetical protein
MGKPNRLAVSDHEENRRDLSVSKHIPSFKYISRLIVEISKTSDATASHYIFLKRKKENQVKERKKKLIRSIVVERVACCQSDTLDKK